MAHGLYIHVPFCISKCRYCDFYSLPLAEAASGSRPDGVEAYLAALKQELARLPAGFSPETVYIGGGTPTAMNADQLDRLLGMVRRVVDRTAVTEWTCEANPGTVDRVKAQALRAGGVNRVSLGVQSFHPANLALLGRAHKAADAEAAFATLREAGFDNLSVDLMYAIPESPRAVLERDLAQAIRMAPEHVSAYCLTFEPGTPFTELRDLGRIREVDDEESFAQYALVRDALDAAGFRQYEISNFARPGKECRHNILYWSSGEYIGCGPAAHSHWRQIRYGNVEHLDRYCRAIGEGENPRASEERLDPESKAREALVTGLRMTDGVSRDRFREQTGFNYRDLRGEEIDRLCAQGLLIEENNRLRLAENALFISNTVFAELV